jgi:hypothetical protein
MKALRFLGTMLLITTVAGSVEAQAAPRQQSPIESANKTTRVVNHEELGRAIVQQAAAAGAKELGAGKKIGSAMDVTFRFTMRDRKNLPDACFEDCTATGRRTALQCYVQCNAPQPPAAAVEAPAENCIEVTDIRIIGTGADMRKQPVRYWLCIAPVAAEMVLVQ